MAQAAAIDQKQLVDLGWTAAPFKLQGTDGNFYTLENARGPQGLLVIFMCNHCPYVQSALDRIIRDVSELKALGIGAIGISSNDVKNYPADNFENMKKLAESAHLPFPYVFDETQEVARTYDAACTPEFYGFNAELKLVYHGRIDAGGKNAPPAGAKRELFDAMKMVAETGQGPAEQSPSIGCSIKWKS